MTGCAEPATAAERAGTTAIRAAHGALVSEAVKDSPAEKAGLRAQDIITRIDGHEVRGAGALRGALRSHKAGDTVSLTVRRSAETLTVRVPLSEGGDK